MGDANANCLPDFQQFRSEFTKIRISSSENFIFFLGRGLAPSSYSFPGGPHSSAPTKPSACFPQNSRQVYAGLRSALMIKHKNVHLNVFNDTHLTTHGSFVAVILLPRDAIAKHMHSAVDAETTCWSVRPSVRCTLI